MDPVPTIPISSTPMPCRSVRVVKQLKKFMYLGNSFGVILKEHDIDPICYDDTTSDVYTHFFGKRLWR